MGWGNSAIKHHSTIECDNHMDHTGDKRIRKEMEINFVDTQLTEY